MSNNFEKTTYLIELLEMNWPRENQRFPYASEAISSSHGPAVEPKVPCLEQLSSEEHPPPGSRPRNMDHTRSGANAAMSHSVGSFVQQVLSPWS